MKLQRATTGIIMAFSAPHYLLALFGMAVTAIRTIHECASFCGVDGVGCSPWASRWRCAAC